MNTQHYEQRHQQMNSTNPHNQYTYSSPQKKSTGNIPYPIDEYQYKEIEQRRIIQQQRVDSNNLSPSRKLNTPQQNSIRSPPPQLVSQISQNSVLSNASIYPKELAFFEYFGHTYNEVIADSTTNKTFTPYIQLKWAITLFIFSFHSPFVQHYNINCVELHRPLNQKELHHNSRIILEHAMKVLSRLCTPIQNTGKREFPGGYPMALYFMGQLYSQKLDFDFLLGFFDNDPVGSQQCNINKTEYNELLKNLQSNLSNNKILPLNDFNAFKYYDKCYKALHVDEDESASDWILCGVSNLFRLAVCLEHGRGCDLNLNKSMQLFWEAWKNWKDPVSGYKIASKIFKEAENYEFLDDFKNVMKTSDIFNAALRILKELDSPQSNFEMAKYYERMYVAERFDQYDKDLLAKLILKCYLRSFELKYNLASWKLGQIFEFGLYGQQVDIKKSLNFYFQDIDFPLNCLSISGWLLTGDKSTGLKPDDNESFKWLNKALNCANGARYNKILYGLGIYYQFGIGCEGDREKCLEYMTQAANLNHPGAKKFLLENS